MRENFAARETERWQPPPFRPARGRLGHVVAVARRLLDLQAASIWRDLSVELECVDGSVLDVGAGAQPYRGLLPARATYHAIDIAEAREVFGYDVHGVQYFEGDRWPLEAESVDVVMSTETLEHVLEPQTFLTEARRVTRRGGRIILTVPFAARWHYILHDYWRFTPTSLRNLLEGAGFSDVSVYARGNALTVACSKAMALIFAGLLRPDGPAAQRAAALLAAPALLVLAPVGLLSLRAQGGEDCLGWTVTATAA